MSFKQVRERHAKINLSGKSAIVFGGTSGIGEGIAGRLAKANVSVYIIGRNAERGNKVLNNLRSFSSDPKAKLSHKFIPCDAKLLSNIAKLVKESDEQNNDKDNNNNHLDNNNNNNNNNNSNNKLPPVIDYLVLTQGIASMADRTETSEGLDEKLSLHYYSRVAAVYLLAPRLFKSINNNNDDNDSSGSGSSGPRILSVLSAGVHSEYPHWKEDPELKQNFSLKNAANAAGMYNDLAMESLSKEFPNFSFTHAAPGIVNTNWGTELPWYARAPIRLLQPFFKGIDECGELLSSPLFDQEYAPTINASKNDNDKIGSSGSGKWYLCNEYGAQIAKRNYPDQARETVWSNTKAILMRIGVLKAN